MQEYLLQPTPQQLSKLWKLQAMNLSFAALPSPVHARNPSAVVVVDRQVDVGVAVALANLAVFCNYRRT
jgi:hypothetical protein